MKFSIKFPILLGHLTQSVLIVLRASVLRALISLHFRLPLENNKSMPFVTIFVWSSFMIRWLWTLNFSLWNSSLYYPWGLMGGTKYVKKKSNMFFFTSTRDKKWMYALIYIIKTKCAVMKHSTYIEKIYGPWVRCSDFRAGPIWQNSENVFKSLKIFFSIPIIIWEILNAWL